MLGAIGIGGSHYRLRPCHTTRHVGPHRAVREVEVMRAGVDPDDQSDRLSARCSVVCRCYATSAWNWPLRDVARCERTSTPQHRQTNSVEERAVKTCGRFDPDRIELGHPQARQREYKPARDLHSPGRTVPVRFAAAQAEGELESAQDAKDHGADNVQQHGQRCREEPRVVRCDLRTDTDLNHADGSGNNRDEAECYQPSGHKPISFCGGCHAG